MRSDNLKFFTIIITLSWTIIILTSLIYNVRLITSKQNNLALEHAKSSYNKNLIFRKWVAMHGGVYVFPTEKTPPNPYLSHIPNRDLITTTGQKLTLMNPAYTLRELMTNFKGLYGETGHITSLRLMNPKNEADEWERKVLTGFDKKEYEEYSEIYKYKDRNHIRYMKSLKVDTSCLKCHHQQGYKIGDTRGGISITIPMEKYENDGFTEKKYIVVSHLLLYLVGLFIIITGKRKMQSLLKKNEEKESLLLEQSKMVAMGEILGNIAHQWRQPLSVISTASTGAKLEKEMGILSDENFNKTMDTINDNAQYLSSTIEDFRGFFNPSNNIHSEFPIIKTIDKTLNLIASRLTSKNIEIVKNIEDTAIISIENKLIQVLINIINNAIDCLNDKEDQKKYIFITAYKKENEFIIEIKDNGNGVPENIIHKVFEPYFTTKHQSQGTGIGLYMSSEIVRKHLRGYLFVKNEKYTYDKTTYTGANFIIKIKLDRRLK